MGDAGFNRGRNRTVTGNKGGIEVIEEEYHGFCRPVNQAMRKGDHSC